MAHKKKKPEPSRRDFIKWLAIGASTSLATTSYANCEAERIGVERHELKLPRWDADGFRVAVLADLHVDSQQDVDHTLNAFQLAIAEKPDLIAIPGDFITLGLRLNPAFVLKSLEPLHDARCTVVATLGNHDFDQKGVCLVDKIVRKSAATLLRNETLEVGGVTVAGIDDGLARHYDMGFLSAKSYSRSLLALFHEPDFVEYVPDHVSLQLSGHSHGGQICLPGGIPLHTPRGANNYFSGYYPDAKVPLYVTRGVGTTGPRLRLFCPPEVTVLTLRAGDTE